MSAQAPKTPPEPKYFSRVPACIDEWRTFAAMAKVQNKWLGDLEKMGSGQKQFLLFRVIIATLPIDEFDPADFDLQNKCARAKKFLEESESFQSFLDAIEENAEGGLGYFAPIREQQLEILAPKPDKTKVEGPAGLDESPVNSTLINFLKAVQEIILDRHYRWRYTKAHLEASFSSPAVTTHGAKRQKPDDRSFTAITDGQLQHIDSYRIKIVLECKRDRRQKCGPQVDMQEAAELVAWVRQYPSNERQRVVVSQNGPEMYVTFGRYDNAWLSYLDGKDSKGKKSFFEMTRIGPFLIDQADDMRAVAEILLCLAFVNH